MESVFVSVWEIPGNSCIFFVFRHENFKSI